MFKRCFTVFAAAAMLLVSLGGCSGSGSEQPDIDLQELVNTIAADDEGGMLSDITEQDLTDYFGIAPEDVVSYAGKFTLINVQVTNIVAVRAQPGRVEAVRQGLERRKSEMEQHYLPQQQAVAVKGEVVTKGDYVFLLILGSDADEAEEMVANAKGLIDGYFA